MSSRSYLSCRASLLANSVPQRRSYPGGPADHGNAFMAAELLAKLVPSASEDTKAIARRTVEDIKSEFLALEPALLVQLNRANGENLAVKATKVQRVLSRPPPPLPRAPCAVRVRIVGEKELQRIAVGS